MVINYKVWLLYYDLLPVSKLKDVAMTYPCHLSIHQGFVGSFASHNHYLAIDEKTNFPPVLIELIMFYHVHPDLIHAIPMLAHVHARVQALALALAQAQAEEVGDDDLSPPLSESVLRDRKTSGL